VIRDEAGIPALARIAGLPIPKSSRIISFVIRTTVCGVGVDEGDACCCAI
jgi:hypothetical protein